MDVFDTVMDFMYEFGLEPSKSLKEEYRNSEFNRKLTTFPEYEYLNSLYVNGFSKKKYEFMKMRFKSRPPFVYYFNPDIQLEEHFGRSNNGNRYYRIGFSSKGTKVRLLKRKLRILVLLAFIHLSYFNIFGIMRIE